MGTVAELTRLLFGDDRESVHGRFRQMCRDDRFRPDHGASAAQQISDSYERLRLVNECVDALELARDPRGVAVLQEWTACLDGALTVVSGIHYNLFLGSLLDHDGLDKRPLAEYAAMGRIGTFLCTELGHGNDAAALRTTATYDPDDRTFTLHTPTAAAQKFMPNTSQGGRPQGRRGGRAAPESRPGPRHLSLSRPAVGRRGSSSRRQRPPVAAAAGQSGRPLSDLLQPGRPAT
ncbi:hypothetical protein [Streptomyces sp. NPDC002573]|uniref:hypothetical protein n=1 Tax=Streptomyces sp. NPDC002573 TaxID=3364651 RepID=UPI0036BED814